MVTVVSGSLLNVSAIIRKKILRIRRSAIDGTIMSLSASHLSCKNTNKEELKGNNDRGSLIDYNDRGSLIDYDRGSLIDYNDRGSLIDYNDRGSLIDYNDRGSLIDYYYYCL